MALTEYLWVGVVRFGTKENIANDYIRAIADQIEPVRRIDHVDVAHTGMLHTNRCKQKESLDG